MKKSSRILLPKKEKLAILYLQSEESNSPSRDRFVIDLNCKEGGSCVCYDAVRNGSKKGKLKEFYPVDGTKEYGKFHLERSADNHIVSTPDTWEEFRKQRDSFIEPYILIRQKMLESPKESVRNSIPPFTIYYACDKDGNKIDYSTVYIWTEDLDTIVFSEYIKDIHKDTSVLPECKLYTVLQVIISLAECIQIFHDNNLLHLDIKPQNFSVPLRNGKLITGMIQLFDIDSITCVGDTPQKMTDGFGAPELRNRKACKASDIYSIGCTLYSALVNSAIGFSDRDYSRLASLVKNSPLITVSNNNSNIYFNSTLSRILNKCLSKFCERRYESCDNLIEDLEGAVGFLYPEKINPTLPYPYELRVSDRELDSYRGPGMRLSLLYHLYRHPLYEAYDKSVPKDHTLHVMILGFGTYGQEFLDCCLQLGQMRDVKLRVTVLSKDCMVDRDIYCETRPGFTVPTENDNVDRQSAAADQAVIESDYATITFINLDVYQDNMFGTLLGGEIHYLFISLGKDDTNRSVAMNCSRIIWSNSMNCSINYVVQEPGSQEISTCNIVCMQQDISKEPLYQDLERMAFNAHLLWMDGLNIDMNKAWAEFKDRYSYNSSFANAVSVKYRLHDLGLSMDSSPEDTAKSYLEELKKPPQENQPDRKNLLMALEHRRWIYEKLCDGYTPITDLESCVEGKTNDKKNKRHICLVPSSEYAPLQTAAWMDDNHSKWDTATDEELNQLDELDRVSVKLHRAYQKRANEMRANNPLLDNVKTLASYAQKSKAASIAFSEWYAMLSLLFIGANAPVREYNDLKERLTKALGKALPHLKAQINELIKTIDAQFAVILDSMKYTDWKQIDERLIDGIPFILTYRTDLHLAIPFSTGTNTQIFGNVVVPTLVNPKQVTYVYSVTHADYLQDFLQATQYVFSYLPEKNLHAKIHFVLAYKKDTVTQQQMQEVEIKLKSAYGEVEQVILLESTEGTNDFGKIKNALRDTLRVDAFEKNPTGLSRLLEEAGVYTDIPSYSFHVKNKEFYDNEKCDYLNYIRAQQYLKASDMFASKDAKGIMSSPLTFHNTYKTLWETYRTHVPAWKRLCALLARYHHESDTVASIQPSLFSDRNDKTEDKYIRPRECFAGADKLISSLVEAQVLGSESSVFHSSPDHCEIRIRAAAALKDTVRKLFTDSNLLSHPDSISIVNLHDENSGATEIQVRYDRLEVKGLDLSKEQNAESVVDLLRILMDEFSFLDGLTEFPKDSRIISFSYSIRQVKKLLTSADSILKNYMYLKCLTSGLFDDVTASYQILEDDNSISDEFDMVVTKGFNSLMIEVKNSEEIDQSVYSDLVERADRYGTCSKAVLVADTEHEVSDQAEAVYTVFGNQDISSIDSKLHELLEREQERESTITKHTLRDPSQTL